MSETITATLLAALGFLTIECLEDGTFQLIGNSPQWYVDFCGESFFWDSNNFNLVATFPFIEVFLYDAETFWQESKDGQLKSGPWTEVDLAGKEYHLEALALFVEKRRIVLIENISVDYDEKQILLQKLRESSLNQDQIIKNIRAEILTGQNTLIIGELLANRYKITSVLGKGGLGIVYKALDQETNNTVAIKMLLENATDTNYSQQLFEREMKILRRVNHSNVVSILDSGLTQTAKPYFVMDYVEGSPLNVLMEEERVWSLERTFNLLKHICPALNAIHQAHVIHRDLKPANIMVKNVDGQEIGIILDLGIAKIIINPKDNAITKLTKTGVIIGTVQYLSPEQCLGKLLDHRTDIYALGMIVYELLTGMLPYESDTVEGWLFEHLKTIPEPLTSFNPTISSAVNDAVLWALEKKRENRPQTMLEFLEKFAEAGKFSY